MSGKGTLAAWDMPTNNLFCDLCGSILQPSATACVGKCSRCPRERTLPESTPVVCRTNMRAVFGFKERKNVAEAKDQRPTVRVCVRACVRVRVCTVEEVCSSPPKVERVCEQCGKNEMVFSTAQLRSVDEGQTIFYECVDCGFVNVSLLLRPSSLPCSILPRSMLPLSIYILPRTVRVFLLVRSQSFWIRSRFLCF